MLITCTVLASALFAPQEIPPVSVEAGKGEETKVAPAEAAKRIQLALKAGVGPALDVIDKYGRQPSTVVTKAMSAGLRHKDTEVVLATVKALRYNEDRSALTELLKVKSKKQIIGDEKIGPEYYFALGQHADKRALKTLAKNLHATRRGDRTLRARVLSLGRIRERASVEALIKFVQSGRKRNGADARTSLEVLTGRQGGKRQRAWTTWWRDNKSGFKVDPELGELSKRTSRVWVKLWRDPADAAAAAAEKKAAQEQKKKKRAAKKAEAAGK